ncbi:hypothetical protein SAMN04487958_102387 [Vreelandella subterranea]|uniref:Uncharacterized protein n=1 Tax=Vreelandella subterranea TaxID=416874 RepID=A0A1H9RGP7_9GAMM|nr:hypothetical protein SAMN04487958_102387 [Halomonas subterranea]
MVAVCGDDELAGSLWHLRLAPHNGTYLFDIIWVTIGRQCSLNASSPIELLALAEFLFHATSIMS